MENLDQEMTEIVSPKVVSMINNPPIFVKSHDGLSSERVHAIQAGIDLNETGMIAQFATDSQQGLSSFCDKILDETSKHDIEKELNMLGDVVMRIEGVDVKNLGKFEWLANVPVLGDRLAYTYDKFKLSFKDANARIDTIQKQLDASIVDMDTRISTLDSFYNEHKSLIKRLDEYIVAGEQAIKDFLQNDFAVAVKKAEESKDPLDIQAVHNLEGQIVRFHARLTNLDITRNKSIFSLPVSKTLQDNFLTLQADFNEIIHNVIPMWKTQFVAATNARKANDLLKISTDIKDRTNKSEMDFADEMLSLQQTMNEQIGRGVLDPETLKAVSDKTCQMITERRKHVKAVYDKQLETRNVIQESQSDLKKVLSEAMMDFT
ncbi:toxic anion resistance protein [Vibrio alginolyticus]|uniref:toxic anion resistance protein n=1 Tax=Vibrio TaxID=662 RepID=UPI0006CA7394|nr:toxic anion resistance protein [Vibrio alginolyticus]KPM98674.1 hypothetical protein AOG25_09725 [Vibrio alginolyticus]CAH7167821.1 conserved hypothetical protein [Vibrio chagasii]